MTFFFCEKVVSNTPGEGENSLPKIEQHEIIRDGFFVKKRQRFWECRIFFLKKLLDFRSFPQF